MWTILFCLLFDHGRSHVSLPYPALCTSLVRFVPFPALLIVIYYVFVLYLHVVICPCSLQCLPHRADYCFNVCICFLQLVVRHLSILLHKNVRFVSSYLLCYAENYASIWMAFLLSVFLPRSIDYRC